MHKLSISNDNQRIDALPAPAKAKTHVGFLSGVERDGTPLRPPPRGLAERPKPSGSRIPMPPAPQRAVAQRQSTPPPTPSIDTASQAVQEKAALVVRLQSGDKPLAARQAIEALLRHVQCTHTTGVGAVLGACRVDGLTLWQHAAAHSDWQAMRILLQHGACENFRRARLGDHEAWGTWGRFVTPGVAWVFDTRDGHTVSVGEVTAVARDGIWWPTLHGFGYQYYAPNAQNRDYAIAGTWRDGALQPGHVHITCGASHYEGSIDAERRFEGVGVWHHPDEDMIGCWKNGALQNKGVLALCDGIAIGAVDSVAKMPEAMHRFIKD